MSLANLFLSKPETQKQTKIFPIKKLLEKKIKGLLNKYAIHSQLVINLHIIMFNFFQSDQSNPFFEYDFNRI